MRRVIFLRDCVPPHPGPLPQGEGIPCAALGGIETLRIGDQRRTVLPLPGGEGRGEGGRRSAGALNAVHRLIAYHSSLTTHMSPALFIRLPTTFSAAKYSAAISRAARQFAV